MRVSRRELVKLAATAGVALQAPDLAAAQTGPLQLSRSTQLSLLLKGLFVLDDSHTQGQEGDIQNGNLVAHFLKVPKHEHILTLERSGLDEWPGDLLLGIIVTPSGQEYGVFNVSDLQLSIQSGAKALRFRRSPSVDACPPKNWNDLFYIVSVPRVKKGAQNLVANGKRSTSLEMSIGSLEVLGPSKVDGNYLWRFVHLDVTRTQFASDQLLYNTPGGQLVTLVGKKGGRTYEWKFKPQAVLGSLTCLPDKSGKSWDHFPHLCDEFDGQPGCPDPKRLNCNGQEVPVDEIDAWARRGVDISYCPPGKRP